MRKTIKGILIGVLVGASLTSIDGAILGALFGTTPTDGERVETVLHWAGSFAIAGAVIGGFVGGLLALFAHRLVLKPREKNENSQTS